MGDEAPRSQHGLTERPFYECRLERASDHVQETLTAIGKRDDLTRVSVRRCCLRARSPDLGCGRG